MVEAIASVGFLLLLGAFTLNAAGRIDRSAFAYDAMNAIGAGILAWYAILHETPIFVALEMTWSIIALANLGVKLWRRR